MKIIKLSIFIFLFLSTFKLPGFDELFEKKLKHMGQFKPAKHWTFLQFDDSFSLIFTVPESFPKRITSLAIKDDKIIILDNNRNQVLVFDTYGSFLKSAGRKGRGPGDLDAPYWMDIYRNDLYIKNNNGIDVFGQDLKFIRRIRPFLLIKRFSIDDDYIYSSIRGSYKGNYPLLMKLNMHGGVEKVIYSEDLRDPLFQDSKVGHVITLDKRVVLVSKHWNRVYFYEKESGAVRKVKINYGLLDKIEQWNQRKMNRKPGNIKWYSNMIASARSHRGTIYLLLKIPRLEIISIDSRGNIREHFFNDDDFRFMRWFNFDIEQKGDKLFFYVAGYSKGTEKRRELSELSVYRVFVQKK
jgi:hypothetical protein